MKQKQLVKTAKGYVEQYVDKGPSRAVLNHGRPVRALADRTGLARNSGRKQLSLGTLRGSG